MSKYQWQGIGVKAEFGSTFINVNKKRPLWWSNFECSVDTIGRVVIPVVLITIKGKDSFMIANHYGIGKHKLINGGLSSYRHFIVKSDDIDWIPDYRYSYDDFDEEAFNQHEASRNKWQQENYPKQYRETKALKRLIKRRVGVKS